MPNITVNGKKVEFEQGMTVLQACELAGAEIPRFCYHERLKIAGNCRMCLVQIEGGPPKPAASCAMPAGDGMVVHTDSPMVKKAREGVMEFLLINHPLDCPICDQGGECDLQDQAMAYGRGTTRFEENKRAVKNKYMGPLVKTHMTRCIQCTRCVRFLDDVAGIEELGAVNRGEHMEISTYIGKSLTSELSGNIIDLCPVGALTSKPYAFTARSWELRKAESIDVLDAVGSNIRVDYRGKEVMRILPRLNEAINEEWISDKSRFSYDGLKLQRLDRPYIKDGKKLKSCSWDEALEAAANAINAAAPQKVAAIAGDLVDCESMMVLKELYSLLGSYNIDCRQDGADIDATKRASYLFNTTIEGIEEADMCLLIGTNPRTEAPILNARLRKGHVENNLQLALIGQEAELSYSYEYLGKDIAILEEIAKGKHAYSKLLKKAKKPMIVLGSGLLSRKDAQAIIALAHQIAETHNMIQEDWNGYNVLHRAASRVGGLDLGFVPSAGGKNTQAIIDGCKRGDIEVLYLLGADEIDMSELGDTFVIYQGHHGDAGAHRADIVLPGSAYTEKSGTYVNTEGRVQQTRTAVFPPNEAREDWRIICDLANAAGQPLSYSSLADVRQRMIQVAPHFEHIDDITVAKWEIFGKQGVLTNKAIINPIENFYMTDPISRVSKTMAKCVSDILEAAA